MKLSKGFTLLELMIVVIVIGILSSIAVPSYLDYLRRGRIPEATSELSARRILAEQHFQDNRTYLDVVGPPAFTNRACTAIIGRNFDFACLPAANWTATTYTIQATGKGMMNGFVYEITQDNVRTSPFTAAAPANWIAHTPDDCWVTARDGKC